METKIPAKDFVKYLRGDGYKAEKRKIMIRAIQEEQIKFINVCIEKWGIEFYNEIVPSC